MTKLTERIWIGDSSDAANADLKGPKIGAILNCAHDLRGERGWSDGVEYAQCGLVDGPGNTMAAYYAALFKLCALTLGGRTTLVHEHEAGSRAVAVIIMAQHALYRRGWDYWLTAVRDKIGPVEVHEAHLKAFNRVNWRLVSTALES